MNLGLDDIFSGSAFSGGLSGAFSGGLLGSTVPGIGTVLGAGIGGLAGLGLGAYANSQRDDATSGQQADMRAMMAQMDAQSKQNYTQRIADLNKILAFYGPAQQSWNAAYADPAKGVTGFTPQTNSFK